MNTNENRVDCDENEPRPTVPETEIEGEAAKGNLKTCLGFKKEKKSKLLFYRKTKRFIMH